MEEKLIQGKKFEEERALYGIKDTKVLDCAFEGEEDGESPLKETRNVEVGHCSFSLRYPFWHMEGGKIENTELKIGARAGLWYAKHVKVENSNLGSVKFLRECEDIDLMNVSVDGDEFGWKSNGIRVVMSKIKSIYGFLDSRNIEAVGLFHDGKYSFQYVEDCVFRNCKFDGRDAFWHAKNVTIEDSEISGEYLSWYSENLTLVRCHINSHQPLCYCKNLKLIDCTFGEESDLAFENSDVEGNVLGHVVSIKNPRSGSLVIGSVDEIVHEPDVYETHCSIRVLDQE